MANEEIYEADISNEENSIETIPLHGRQQIFITNDNITEENIITVLSYVVQAHFRNITEEDYLYWYRRGMQPILFKKKLVRPEVNNKVVQNLATEIVTFKDGYFLSQPTFYVARSNKESLAKKVSTLNDYLYLSGKHDADNDIVDWFHTVGIGVLYVASNDDKDEPVKAYSLDPRQAFCVYSRKPGNAPVLGVNMVVDGDKTYFDCFTKDMIYHLEGTYATNPIETKDIPSTAVPTVLVSTEPNLLGEIPIIEFVYDRNRMGAFESVISLLDEVNMEQSRRSDSVESFVNSLLVFYNCQLGKDDNGNDVTPQMIRQAGAIFLKSIGQEKADLKEISSVLDQTQTQVFIDDLLTQIYGIAGVPFIGNSGGGTSGNVGSAYLIDGWQTADTFARNTEDLFKKSNRQFTKIFLKILETKNLLKGLKVSDIDIQFTRNEMDNLLVKTQGALNLKQLGLAPEIVLARSGVSNDPEGDIAKSKNYIEQAFATETKGTEVTDTKEQNIFDAPTKGKNPEKTEVKTEVKEKTNEVDNGAN